MQWTVNYLICTTGPRPIEKDTDKAMITMQLKVTKIKIETKVWDSKQPTTEMERVEVCVTLNINSTSLKWHTRKSDARMDKWKKLMLTNQQKTRKKNNMWNKRISNEKRDVAQIEIFRNIPENFDILAIICLLKNRDGFPKKAVYNSK